MGLLATEVEWRKHGFDGSRLGYLLAGVGLFHQAHRAVDDCRALVEILASNLFEAKSIGPRRSPGTRKTQDYAHLGRTVSFQLKDELKKRGYRWSDGADGRPRSWYIDVDEADEATEIEFLKNGHLPRQTSSSRVQAMNAAHRFSNRA